MCCSSTAELWFIVNSLIRETEEVILDGGLSGIVRVVIIYNVPGLADDNSRFWKLGLPSPTRNVDILTSGKQTCRANT